MIRLALIRLVLLLLLLLFPAAAVHAAILPGDRLAQVHAELLENRRAALPGLSDPFGIPDRARIVLEDSTSPFDTFRGDAFDSQLWAKGIY